MEFWVCSNRRVNSTPCKKNNSTSNEYFQCLLQFSQNVKGKGDYFYQFVSMQSTIKSSICKDVHITGSHFVYVIFRLSHIWLWWPKPTFSQFNCWSQLCFRICKHILAITLDIPADALSCHSVWLQHCTPTKPSAANKPGILFSPRANHLFFTFLAERQRCWIWCHETI